MEKLSLKLFIKCHLKVECDSQGISRMGKTYWLVLNITFLSVAYSDIPKVGSAKLGSYLKSTNLELNGVLGYCDLSGCPHLL